MREMVNFKQGLALVLAWPQTTCKQAGAWYDRPAHYLGISRNGYYRVGHAAIVLIDPNTGQCHYFDFGRYHAPYGCGRVRSGDTDHDLRIKAKAYMGQETGLPANIDSLLQELYQNPSTHGDGAVYGALAQLDWKRAFDYASRLQRQEFLPYGPFVPNGTNCSRFVRSVLLHGGVSTVQRWRLRLPPMVTPTPMWNLHALGGEIAYFDGDASVVGGYPDESDNIPEKTLVHE